MLRSSQRQVGRAQRQASRPGCLPASSAGSARLSRSCQAWLAPQAQLLCFQRRLVLMLRLCMMRWTPLVLRLRHMRKLLRLGLLLLCRMLSSAAAEHLHSPRACYL